MDLRNCTECGRLFTDDGIHKLCERCRDDEEEQFQKVKEYLWDHPNASVEEVSEETGVDKDLIIKFVKEDRLIAEGFELDNKLHCERCGKAIKSGRYCEECKQKLVEGFSNTKNKNKDKKKKNQSDRMFIKDRIDKRKDK